MSEWKIRDLKRQWEWKTRSKMWDMKSFYVDNCGNLSFFLARIAVLRQSLISKYQSGAEKFALKIRSGSGKLSIVGRHFPPKSIIFGTLPLSDLCDSDLCDTAHWHWHWTDSVTLRVYSRVAVCSWRSSSPQLQPISFFSWRSLGKVGSLTSWQWKHKCTEPAQGGAD